jgi:hypothetical protein
MSGITRAVVRSYDSILVFSTVQLAGCCASGQGSVAFQHPRGANRQRPAMNRAKCDVRLLSRAEKTSQGGDVLLTIAHKRVKSGESEDHERRHYPPPTRRRVSAATQASAERHVPATAPALRRFVHANPVTQSRCEDQFNKHVGG